MKRKLIGWQRQGWVKKFYLFGIPILKKESLSRLMIEQIDQLKRELERIKQITIPALVNHPGVFEKYKGIYAGKDVAIIGTGPSLDLYTPIPGVIHIGANRTYQHKSIELDYLFIQDGGTPQNPHIVELPELIEYRKGKCVKFFGYNLHLPINEEFADACGAERYYLEPSRPENPFAFVPVDLAHQPFSCSFSVILVAFQFALWCRPKRIYIVGCDTSNNGYFKDSYGKKEKQHLDVSELCEAWAEMARFAKAHYPDIEIISINPVGLKGLFTDATMQDGKLEIQETTQS